MKTDSSPALQGKPAKNASGSPRRKGKPLISQAGWRKAGAAAIVGAAFMAWYGADAPFLRRSLWVLLAYWSGCLALLLVAVYTVILDIRYIRLQYALGRRQAFLQTLGDKEFRESIRAAQAAIRSKRNGAGNNGHDS